jgi:hypothetical protein
MKPKNAHLVVLVSAVAVAAVAIGGVLAYRQGPQANRNAATPLSVPSTPVPSTTAPTATASTPVAKTPSSPPAKTSTATPPVITPRGPLFTGPVKVDFKLSKLSRGRAPQVPYLVGREVRGGAGQPITIPGSEHIQNIARLGDQVLAIVSNGERTELLKVGTGAPVRTPYVTTLVTTDDERAAAYATYNPGSGRGAVPGGTVYAQTAADGQVHKLSLPKAWDLRVLGYTNGQVYFSWSASEGGVSWRLYTWTPGSSEATLIKTVSSPTGLTSDGRIAASRNTSVNFGDCSSLTEVATGKRLWRTCQNQVVAFTPDGTIAVGAAASQDPWGDLQASALDAKTGTLLREWTGAVFQKTVAEDDQHFLIQAKAPALGTQSAGPLDHDGPETKTAIVRCTVTTGACELAVPPTDGVVLLGG